MRHHALASQQGHERRLAKPMFKHPDSPETDIRAALVRHPPLTMMYSMTPQDQMSLELPSKKLCISASGAVYASVPSALFGSLFTCANRQHRYVHCYILIAD